MSECRQVLIAMERKKDARAVTARSPEVETVPGSNTGAWDRGGSGGEEQVEGGWSTHAAGIGGSPG